MSVPPLEFQYRAADHYWRVQTRPGEVYASARFAFVADTDVTFVAWVAAGGRATVIETEAALRERVNHAGLAYLAEPLPPLEEPRPRVLRARLRLRRTAGQTIASGTGSPVQWAAAGAVDPLGMFDPAQPAQITIPAGQGGIYDFAASASFAANATGLRGLAFLRGANVLGIENKNAVTSGPTHLNLRKPVPLQAGHVVRIGVSQESGADLVLDAAEIALWRIE